jgi:hypothetical protein
MPSNLGSIPVLKRIFQEKFKRVTYILKEFIYELKMSAAFAGQ